MSLEDRSFNYTKSYIYDYIDEPKKRLGRTGCDCLDNCRDKLKCSCWHLTVQRSINNKTPKDVDYRNNVKVGYKDMRLEKIVYTGIVECSSDCECCASTCVNRVLQNGMQALPAKSTHYIELIGLSIFRLIWRYTVSDWDIYDSKQGLGCKSSLRHTGRNVRVQLCRRSVGWFSGR